MVEHGYDPSYGARPVKRYLQKHIETGLAARIIAGEIIDGQEVVIDAKNGTQHFTAE